MIYWAGLKNSTHIIIAFLNLSHLTTTTNLFMAMIFCLTELTQVLRPRRENCLRVKHSDDVVTGNLGRTGGGVGLSVGGAVRKKL